MLESPDNPGLLYMTRRHFKDNRINMIKVTQIQDFLQRKRDPTNLPNAC